MPPATIRSKPILLDSVFCLATLAPIAARVEAFVHTDPPFSPSFGPHVYVHFFFIPGGVSALTGFTFRQLTSHLFY